MTVAFDEALEGDKRFSFAGAPGDGVVTFVLKRAALADRSREDVRLTYQIAESGHDQVALKTANCGADGRLCMQSILRELFAQCRLGA